MGISVVLDSGQQADSEAASKLRKLYRPLLPKIREVRFFRVTTRGRRAPPLQPTIEALYTPEVDDADTFVRELVTESITILEGEAGDARMPRFRVVVYGEGLEDKRPAIAEEVVTVDWDGAPPPTAKSELVNTISILNSTIEGMAKHVVSISGAAPKAIQQTSDLAEKLGAALAVAQNGHHEWEYRRAELEVKARMDAATLEWRAFSSRNMWTTLDGWFKSIEPLLPVLADLIGGAGNAKPTVAEIDALFGQADPDLATLAKKFLAATESERRGLRPVLIKRWTDLPDDRKALVLLAMKKLDQARMLTIALWMKSVGLGQEQPK